MGEPAPQQPDEPDTAPRTELATVASSGSRAGIKPWLQLQLCRDLASGSKTRAQLAREHGVSRTAITSFARRHKARIEEIKAHLDDEFAGLWVAQKALRIEQYQRDLEMIADNGHHEWVKARTGILKAIAEELGQLPPRQQVTIVPVMHVIEGVNMSELT